MSKNKYAVALGKRRWRGTTQAQRSEEARERWARITPEERKRRTAAATAARRRDKRQNPAV